MSMLDYLNERMFKPLGIEKPFWEKDGAGNNVAGWGALYEIRRPCKILFAVYS